MAFRPLRRFRDLVDVTWPGSPTDGHVVTYDSVTDKLVLEAASGGGGSVAVQEGDTTVVATASVIDFAAADFDVTESPSGEANVAIAAAVARSTDLLLPDGITLEESAGTVRVKDGGISVAKLAFDPATQVELDAHASSDSHSGYAVVAPGTSARNTIQPTSAAVSPLIVKGAASQSSALTQWQNSAGTVLTRVKAGGGVDAVTEAAAVPALIAKGATSQTAALQEWQNSAGTVLAAIGAAGFLEMLEQSAPSAPAANKARLYTRDDGAGVTQLVVMFPSGNVVVIAEDF